MSGTTYLAPGFLVTVADNLRVKLPHLRNQDQRSSPARLATIDALNQGFIGDFDALAAQIQERFKVPPGHILAFLEMLDESGFLTREEPGQRFVGEASGATGTLDESTVCIPTPAGLVTQSGQYLWYGHDAKLRIRLSMAEVIAITTFGQPITVAAAWDLYCSRNPESPLTEEEFQTLARRLKGAGLLPPRIAGDSNLQDTRKVLGAIDRSVVQKMVDARVAQHDEKVVDQGKNLLQVVPVNTQAGTAPASLGVVIGYAMEYEGGRLQDKLDFVPMFLTDGERIAERAQRKGAFLFSNYMWNDEKNLELSALVKAANPANVTIHGGPSTPKYDADVIEFFNKHPHVDIAVHGEGEATLADVLDHINLANPADLESLRDVPGITIRTAEGIHRTDSRDRIADVNTIPSPFLMGLFEEFGSASASTVLETNRGCPYGCTFCDWGSATLSKVRKFDLDRVYKELEWCARHGITEASIADANFGMIERDVTITEKIAELRGKYGFPQTVNINYAKNQVKYLKKIIEIMASANILAEGVVSLQTTDAQTLKVIDRSNIKLEKYNELSTEFRQSRLPLAADIMMGLPGSTPKAFMVDLQMCTDRDIRVRANPTQLLPNSPMNSPEYRKEHAIIAKPGEVLKQTASYTRDEWEEMNSLREAYYLLDSYGVLRYIARFVRRELGMGEVEFYDKLRADAHSNPSKWPTIETALQTLEGHMAPPGSWGLFIEEVGRYLTQVLGMPEDSGMRTALTVQHAHLPGPGRQFPEVHELEHDFAAWQAALFQCREEGNRDDWHERIPRLCEFGPATLQVRDPNEICQRDVGKTRMALDFTLRNWELDSPIARARLNM